MFRLAVLLVLGIAIGYFYGFDDAHAHEQSIPHRLSNRFGSHAPAKVPRKDGMDTLLDADPVKHKKR